MPTTLRFPSYPQIVIAALVLLIGLNLLDEQQKMLLTTSPETFHQKEYWRWISCNFVHFGWIHSSINILGFLLASVFMLNKLTGKKFLFLLFFCSLPVGLLISFASPEFTQYAGLSGALHGLFIAGCFYATDFPIWKRCLMFVLIIAKIIDEQLFSYFVNPAHEFINFTIAINAHLIGAIAGLVFCLTDKLIEKFTLTRKKT